MKNITFIKKISDDELLLKIDDVDYVAVSKKNHLVSEFLLACQYGLIRNVTKNLRALTVDWDFLDDKYYLHLLAYFDKNVTEEEKELFSDVVFTEIIARMPNISNPKIIFDVKEEIKILAINEKIEPLRVFVFLRE